MLRLFVLGLLAISSASAYSVVSQANPVEEEEASVQGEKVPFACRGLPQ